MITFPDHFRPSDESSSKRIYLDHNATTPVAKCVIDKGPELLRIWGNPSSIHQSGRDPKRILREARQRIAQHLNCHPLEIVFTSGGSESNATALRSVMGRSSRKKIVISSVEHPSVFKAAFKLKETFPEIEVCVLPVSRHGEINLEEAKSLIDERTALVSVMFANNETGHIFPIQELVRWSHEKGALFHCDAVQALGKVPLDLKALNVDYASFSAHKVYSLKGTGVLYIKRDSPYSALVTGGGQERGRRAGTENTMGIGALFEVLEHLPEMLARGEHTRFLRDRFESLAMEQIPELQITGARSPRLPNTSSLVIPGVDGEVLLMSLDVKGFSVSTGAACSSGNPEPSPVLLSMGLSRQEAQSSLRVSFGLGNTEEDVEKFVQVLSQVVRHLRSLQREGSKKKDELLSKNEIVTSKTSEIKKESLDVHL